jgi:hypothetical protein
MIVEGAEESKGKFIESSEVYQKLNKKVANAKKDDNDLDGIILTEVPKNVIYLGHEEHVDNDTAVFGYGNTVRENPLGERKMIVNVALMPMRDLSKLMKDLKEYDETQQKEKDEDHGLSKDS